MQDNSSDPLCKSTPFSQSCGMSVYVDTESGSYSQESMASCQGKQ